MFTACNSFERDVINDPKYASGIDGESNNSIKPIVKKFGHYTFVSDYSDTASTLGLYYKDKELNIWTSSDGYFDTVMHVNLNNDDIADYIFENAFEDGSTLYALISKSKTEFKEKLITDNYHGIYCLEGADTLIGLQPIVIKDINNNGNN